MTAEILISDLDALGRVPCCFQHFESHRRLQGTSTGLLALGSHKQLVPRHLKWDAALQCFCCLAAFGFHCFFVAFGRCARRMLCTQTLALRKMTPLSQRSLA